MADWYFCFTGYLEVVLGGVVLMGFPEIAEMLFPFKLIGSELLVLVGDGFEELSGLLLSVPFVLSPDGGLFGCSLPLPLPCQFPKILMMLRANLPTFELSEFRILTTLVLRLMEPVVRPPVIVLLPMVLCPVSALIVIALLALAVLLIWTSAELAILAVLVLIESGPVTPF